MDADADGEHGAGRPVLLLHGQPGSGTVWAPVTRLLEGRYRVLAPDRPGYDPAGRPAVGLAANARWAAALLEDRAAHPATVVAHSWSGGAAVLLAVDRPDLVASLVLVGAACTPDSLDATDRILALPGVGDALTAAGLVVLGDLLPRLRRHVHRAPERFRDRLATLLPDRAVLGEVRGARGRRRRTFVAEERALLAELPDVAAALGRVAVPTAVVTGAWDVVVRPASARTLAAAVPGAELIELPRAGHFVARDAPDVLAGVVARYRDRLPPRADTA